LAAVIAGFVVLKKFSFLGEAFVLPFPYLIVGLSYVLFRVLHLMIDAQQGELARSVSPRHFFNYTCNFLSFTAGPIQRYPDYASQQAAPLALDREQVFRAFARVIKGFVKVAAISAIFNNFFLTLSGRLFDTAVAVPPLPTFFALFVAAAVCYTVYLYANFAGYMDIVIGVGALMGQQLPENFNRPFLARSFLDFWSRWHMTLSDWFKTYVFNPLLKVLAARFTSARLAPYLGVIAFFVTFLIMGVWHGTTAVFVVYGLLMGAGASVNKLWQVLMTRRLGKKGYKALAEKTLWIYLSRGLTFAYFALALCCLWVDMAQLLAVLHRLGAVGLIGCYLALSVAAGLAFLAWDALMSVVAPLRHKVNDVSSGVVARNLSMAFQVLLIVTVASFFHKAPEFVYRAF
jgi:D-alanyl-lipoteichoic acid acyltransferase DltB (MBOAT superfamily)